MEVKDVNNTASIQALFSKAVAGSASGQVLGAGFADLIGQVADIVAPSSKDDGAKIAAKDQPVDNKSSASDRADAKKDKPAKKTRPVAEKDEPVARQSDSKSHTPEAAPVQSAQKAAAPEAAKPVAETADEAPAVAEASASAIQPKAGAEAQTRELSVTISDPNAPKIVASMSSDGALVMMPQNVDLQALAQMPVVGVLDVESGEVISMSGADFVKQLQQASNNGNLFIANEQTDGKFMQVIPAEIVEGVKSRFGQADADAPAMIDVEAALVEDSQLAEQAKVLDDKLGRNQKISLNVDVKEEKISYSGSAELVKDKVALDEVVNAALQDKASSTKPAQVNAPISAQSQSAQPVINGQPAGVTSPVGAPLPQADAKISSEAVKAATVDGVSALRSDASSLNGAALAGNARAEGQTRTADTSLRDVYKGMSKEVVDQVKVNITKSAVKGVDNIEIKLKPEDLGQIEIKMQIAKDGKLQAHIIASRPETMEILQKEVQNLEKAFNDAGFQTDEGSLSFSFREGSESGQDRSSELRNFIGNVLERDNTEELVGNDNLLNWNPAQGLNIRV